MAMKHLTLSILFATLSFSLASCTGPAGPVLPLRTGSFELTVEFTPKTGFNYACDGGVVSLAIPLAVSLSIDGSRYVGRPTNESGGDFSLILTAERSTSATLLTGSLRGTARFADASFVVTYTFGDNAGSALLSGTVLTPSTALGAITGPFTGTANFPPGAYLCPNANGSWRLVAK
jgi:hypothetical protein